MVSTNADSMSQKSVFLDVPAPWEAVEFAKNVLAVRSTLAISHTSQELTSISAQRDRMTRICCFSPCIEQVTKTVTALQSAGFASELCHTHQLPFGRDTDSVIRYNDV
jgi:tRNA A58 N-methylase Trm61